ncbi:Acyl-protein synthetase, LuxE [Filimonas lacunae]|uniref:Acyl-protein synthetase, LuxE n=1 Tax=Filimonas lacunae TaxID=477680 RepID=A0A173MJ43_9BACT|nr:acyl transferase [Filimonas lacunae]BAV07499.1 acyl protein synthase/acyl-CoA reductase-like protein [Filimonas lacunae]SIT30167.1 Acyl-protein synthetase, LuxE [Filimonas lacunae]
MPNLDKTNNIFTDTLQLSDAALALCIRQYNQNPVYQQWCSILGIHPNDIQAITQIPFLPVSFFKTHEVVCGSFEPEVVFESSGTTQTVNSRHLVKEVSLYEESTIVAFEREYGAIQDWCVIGLLPAYLERKNSSLVHMVNRFIDISQIPESGFYLYEYDKLYQTLQTLEARGQKTLLIGVTFGLLDFAEAHTMQLQHTVVMETGGMKGRRRELTREEVHGYLTERLGVKQVHSEYGMTELLSQAYSKGEGRYVCQPWMKVLVRDEEDPLHVKTSGRGVINIIDLANRDSCAFIATDDVGIVYEDGSFEVKGRMDASDIRGCSLLMI